MAEVPLDATDTEESQYMLMSRQQNSGQEHNMKTSTRSFENVISVNLGQAETIIKKLTGEINSGNPCCYSAQNLSSSRPLTKNLRLK
jgi:hypothetical protein